MVLPLRHHHRLGFPHQSAFMGPHHLSPPVPPWYTLMSLLWALPGAQDPTTQPWASSRSQQGRMQAGIPLSITHRGQAPAGSSGTEMSACRSPSAVRKGKPERAAAFYHGEFKRNLLADRSSSCKEISTHPPYFFFFLMTAMF